ncbi:hypothetical protein [Polaribacter sp.]|uniref:hypothetical protein n=1 Tax=Polaribacter sp. TaxID=1920175 RepID=UPI004048016A
MNIIKNPLTAIFFFFISAVFVAQNQNNTSCSGEKYNQFDFWEGNWKVYDKEGDLVGTNKVVKLQNNCVLQENWVSKLSQNTGTSYNYYNPKDDTWNQIWIDNSGFIMNLKGRFKDGKMTLKSDLIEANPRSFANQITWKKNKDNTVTQIWTTVDEKGKVIYEIFYGIYKKTT